MVSVLPISNVVSVDTFLAHVSPTVILPMASILLSLCPSSPFPSLSGILDQPWEQPCLSGEKLICYALHLEQGDLSFKKGKIFYISLN